MSTDQDTKFVFAPQEFTRASFQLKAQNDLIAALLQYREECRLQAEADKERGFSDNRARAADWANEQIKSLVWHSPETDARLVAALERHKRECDELGYVTGQLANAHLLETLPFKT
jgi:hypothetical protein